MIMEMLVIFVGKQLYLSLSTVEGGLLYGMYITIFNALFRKIGCSSFLLA